MKLHPRVTPHLVDQVKRFEGLRRRSAALAEGGYTVGYGHTRSARADVSVSPADAEALLYYDLSLAAAEVEAHCFAPLTHHQFEALTAFAFNIGAEEFRTSAALALVNEGRMLEAADAMEAWRQGELAGRRHVIDALVRRRACEKALFLTPPHGFTPAPTPVVRPRLDPRYDAFVATLAPHAGPRQTSPDPPTPPSPGREGRSTAGAEPRLAPQTPADRERPEDLGADGQGRYDALVRRLRGAEGAKGRLEADRTPPAARPEPPPVEGAPPPLPAALAPFGETGTFAPPRRGAAKAPGPASRRVSRPSLSALVGAAIFTVLGLALFVYGTFATLAGQPGLRSLATGLVGILLATIAGSYVLRRLAARGRLQQAV